jgi:hypothetical protein
MGGYLHKASFNVTKAIKYLEQTLSECQSICTPHERYRVLKTTTFIEES